MRWSSFSSPRAMAVVAVATIVVAAVLVAAIDTSALVAGARVGLGQPGGLVLTFGALLLAFAARAVAWCRVMPGLTFGHSLAGIHLALAGNHVLPFRLGEPLRVLSVRSRTDLEATPLVASTVWLRSADIVALALVGAVAAPAIVARLLDDAVVVLATLAAVVAVGIGVATAVRQGWLGSLRWNDPLALGLAVVAWGAEAVAVQEVLGWFGVDLGLRAAAGVLAAAVLSQIVAITPAGVGTYEAAGTAALVAAGIDPTAAVTAVVGLHAAKTLYSLAAGGTALVVPAPGLLGRFRLDSARIAAPVPTEPAPDGPIVLFLPAHNEGPRVADVVGRAPATIDGRPVEVVVVDDGSTDDTAARAAGAGALVIPHPANLGLGAAVRTGFAHAHRRGAAAAAFCDADGEYDPADLADLVGPILRGEAHYVVGSRFAGEISRMLPHRRFGNQTLTRWVRWVARRPITDGQSGYRACSAAATAELEIVHDYNYAQVLTVDLVRKGFGYHEVPITYAFRSTGRSFIRLGTYLRRCVPAVWHLVNRPPRSAAATPSQLSIPTPTGGTPHVHTP